MTHSALLRTAALRDRTFILGNRELLRDGAIFGAGQERLEGAEAASQTLGLSLSCGSLTPSGLGASACTRCVLAC